jgi:propionate CoA-transferase
MTAKEKLKTFGEAAGLIKDGDTVGINAFLSLANPEGLHRALAERIEATGHPNNLDLWCATGFGGWDENLFADRYIKIPGAVRSVTAGHWNSMPAASRMAAENKIEGYNMPLGVMTHMQRAAAGKKPALFSDIGLNTFVDPRFDGPGLNARSKRKWVELTHIDGRETLLYRTPKIDVAFIRGTTADPAGNISFEKECVTADALSLAQATRANGGKVIVQVERLGKEYMRPRSVIVPGILVDVIVLCPDQEQIYATEYNPSLSGDVHVPPGDMGRWVKKLPSTGNREGRSDNVSHKIIGRRAARELCCGYVVNLGIGIPEYVGTAAAELGSLDKITMTVESGGIGGLPAPGIAFGATIGADVITNASEQFDFYDGGGLDMCFLGAFEIDREGSVHAHRLPGRIAGIGGFANISQSTRNVIFCCNFTSGGLVVKTENGKVRIVEEGRHGKFVERVYGVSYSAKNGLRNYQNVLYVTERCVFRLTGKGLELTEIAPGVDLKTQILDLLPFKPSIAKNLKTMEI